MEQVMAPDPAEEQTGPGGRHAGQVEGERARPSRWRSPGPMRPVTVAVEVLAMVIPHPPSVPGVTWFCSGGVDAGT